MSKTTDAVIDRMYGMDAWTLNQITKLDEVWEMTQKCMASIVSIDRELVRKFAEFHHDNPHVYDELRDLALRAKRHGRSNYSINGLYEVLRWHRSFETDDPEFKLSNNHRAYYARLLMVQEPELEGFFRTRKTKHEV